MTLRHLLLLLALLPGAWTFATPSPSPAGRPELPTEFDTYVLVLLVRPPDLPALPKEQLEELGNGHFANMKRLAGEGKLFKAGPVKDESGRDVRGIFILATDSVEKARAWVATDPLVNAGRLVPEYMRWSVEKGTLK